MEKFERRPEGGNNVEQFIELIYHEIDDKKRKALIELLSSELRTRQTPSDFVRRRNIERLIELIYHEKNRDFRRVLTALLAAEEAACLARCDQP